jgi:hypothetical protein
MVLECLPAQDILWMDAGLVVLKPIDEVWDLLHHQEYVQITKYQFLGWGTLEAACEGCGMPLQVLR